MNITVSLVDDERTVLTALAELINGTPGLHCRGAYRTAEAAVAQVPRPALNDQYAQGTLLQSGSRFSRKASRPSRASSVP